MNIAIYWMQKDYGGVDVHLLSFLNNWPDKNDNFILFVNYDNAGYSAIKDRIPEKIKLDVIRVHPGWIINKNIFLNFIN